MNPPSHHHHHRHQAMILNPKSLKTKFALKFLRALRNIKKQENKKNSSNNNISSTFMVAQRYQKVKVAAEASMALAIGPRRAWSRAILIRVQARSSRIIPMGRGRSWRRQAGSAQAHGQLRRLVPGGEAMDMKRLLDETAHYIKCLSTQVKVMRGIVNYYSSSTA